MEKKKMARALMLTAALAGGITMAQSFYNEAHATGGSITCKCGLMWGTGCKSSNQGGTCAETSTFCSVGQSNC